MVPLDLVRAGSISPAVSDAFGVRASRRPPLLNTARRLGVKPVSVPPSHAEARAERRARSLLGGHLAADENLQKKMSKRRYQGSTHR